MIMEDLWMMRSKNNNGNGELKNNGEDNGKKLEALADGRKVQVIKIIRSSIPTTVNDNTSTNYKVKVIMKEQIMVTKLLFRFRLLIEYANTRMKIVHSII
ncbi:unnamed protein product [Rhizophagus irregularis]|nr:unnamed protein product [Rhizophagus irregularis]CAB4432652.1 unnamed protein product [Rhizophagus irregularis]